MRHSVGELHTLLLVELSAGGRFSSPTLESFTIQLYPRWVISHINAVIEREETFYWCMAFVHTPRAKKQISGSRTRAAW